jgi:hypothetical protein
LLLKEALRGKVVVWSEGRNSESRISEETVQNCELRKNSPVCEARLARLVNVVMRILSGANDRT